MCGRLNVLDDPFSQIVSGALGLTFKAKPNEDLIPTDALSVVAVKDQQLHQLELNWGIKPNWANRVIINAQAESVASKPTFRDAFVQSRVALPCSGWYEWSDLDGEKLKYLFKQPDDSPFYMGAVGFSGSNQMVTLTTQPTPQYLPYHHRMPFLIPSFAVRDWLFASPDEAKAMLQNWWPDELAIVRVS
ncbi:SOS response-associated peptidase [Vibrio maerlii]|uniref:SOS response-associated peptidase n=1 Tax=Vibrio maerlii TaxID=2231648 RepID=UPI000E3E1D1D|nr:SOS response-associated peptidase family protein [Vibrio maerlii]